jgi:hypothetical protein
MGEVKYDRFIGVKIATGGYEYLAKIAEESGLSVSDVVRAGLRFASLHPPSQWLPPSIDQVMRRKVDKTVVNEGLRSLAEDLAEMRRRKS